MLRAGSGDSAPSLNYAAIYVECWWTSLDALSSSLLYPSIFHYCMSLALCLLSSTVVRIPHTVHF